MTKVQITPQPLVCSTPTVLVGSMSEGKPAFMTVAWCGVACSDPPMVSVAIRTHRHTMKGIYQMREFSVNVPSIDQVKEVDYCGTVSGATVDKVKVCGFSVFFGQLPNAPLIEQCPVNLECKVEHILSLGTHQLVIGKVAATHVTDTCITDGKPDLRKIRPFLFTSTLPQAYLAFGEGVGKQFVIGKELEGKKSKK